MAANAAPRRKNMTAQLKHGTNANVLLKQLILYWAARGYSNLVQISTRAYKIKGDFIVLRKVNFVILIFGISLITMNLPAQIVEDGLVSYWSFDADKISGKTVTDGTGNYDGTINGNPKKVAGQIGDALEFDGDETNFVEIDKPEEFDFNVDFTWSAWIKTGVVGPGVIFAKTGGSPVPMIWDLKPYGSAMVSLTWIPVGSVMLQIQRTLLTINGTTSLSSVFRRTVQSNSLLMVRRQVKTYLILPNFLKTNGTIFTFSSVWTEERMANSGYSAGIIDEFSVYNRVLEEAEINQNFNADTGLAVDPNGKLAATWGAIKARQ